MIGVDRIDDIGRLGRGGASVASISRGTGVSEPTVRKYLREPDLSERPPAVGRADLVILDEFGGPSHRLEESLMLGKSGS